MTSDVIKVVAFQGYYIKEVFDEQQRSLTVTIDSKQEFRYCYFRPKLSICMIQDRQRIDIDSHGLPFRTYNINIFKANLQR